ncbi:hypothetical protein KUTeg_009849 [Tegillarca granosa]|uniref:L-serine ammonia-lyase n=1 Tax=Tegillarca granosa TaxID=220873 RepID=A0ABQ9F8C9_TEGGR|nr:hypothetical protein KUTeg_009849 [Tegillarca granosa]
MDKNLEKECLNASEHPLHMVTPTIHSAPLSKLAGFPVYLKLENLQIPGSFKIRGVGNFCKKAYKSGCRRIVCASGGNAGLAAAYAAKQLKVPATIVLPTTTPDFVADKLRDYGAEVQVHGSVWDESNKYALKLATDPDCAYVHPFDHPDIWYINLLKSESKFISRQGHATMIAEAKEQLPCQPDVVIASVGGGGLLNGVIEGMWNVGWKHVPVIAMETEGADCLNAAIKDGKLVTLPAITSVAKSLGALTCSKKTFEYYNKHKMHSVLVHDKQAIEACLKFADDHRMLVEPACGASLASVYSDVISKLEKDGKLPEIKSALIVVCGGSGVSLEALQKWKSDFGL